MEAQYKELEAHFGCGGLCSPTDQSDRSRLGIGFSNWKPRTCVLYSPGLYSPVHTGTSQESRDYQLHIRLG